MEKINRNDLYEGLEETKLSKSELDVFLTKYVYANKEDWNTFVKLFLLSFGFGFFILGIVFFFAFNWQELHKFIKLGLIGILILCTTTAPLFVKISNLVKNCFLTVSCILVGVLFATFGQIYQTGANAYDFFLAWLLCISIWVIIANFKPLWLLYLVLMSTTFISYDDQVGTNLDEIMVSTLIFCQYGCAIIVYFIMGPKRVERISHNWFIYVLSAIFYSIGTLTFIKAILSRNPGLELFTIYPLASLAYITGLWYGFKQRVPFYIVLIFLCIISVITCIIIKIYDGRYLYLAVTFFVLISVAATVKTLLNIQKSNDHGVIK